jgi:hypothetical protein
MFRTSADQALDVNVMALPSLICMDGIGTGENIGHLKQRSWSGVVANSMAKFVERSTFQIVYSSGSRSLDAPIKLSVVKSKLYQLRKVFCAKIDLSDTGLLHYRLKRGGLET